MDKNNSSLFAADALEAPCDMASALASPARAGHFDELRGRTRSRTALPAPAGGQSQSQSQGPSSGPQSSQSQTQSQTGNTLAALTLARAAAATSTGPATATASDQPPVPAPPADSAEAPLTAPWTTFFNFLGTEGFSDLNHRSVNLQRQIRDNGVTYNVYADDNGPQRPWSLDLFPLILSPDDWAQIDTGIRQRTRLLNSVMADVYGPQNLLSQGLLPAALVQGNPGYLRAMQGVKPAGGVFLHIAAFDLARGPDGRWWVVSQRTQAPSGLGYLLENRLSISLLFPQAFREMKVRRLAASYKALVDNMKALTGARDSRIVLLTPGPYNETYFEHAYLARYLGLSLVEGSDLLVRDEKLYIKTLQGLEPVHGLLKRLDDEFLDPLELRSDSTLGVPGLLQVIRAGNVLVANAPGSAFLESSAILGFLPALADHLLGETLSLPSLATWWCGEQAVMQDVLPQLKNCVIKPTYPDSKMPSVIGHTLTQRALDEWAGRIVRQGEDFTVQAYLPLSQTPTWQGERISPRSAMLRVFAVSDGAGSWQVLPGGLARLAGTSENIASMQHGGSSADVWALGDLASNTETASVRSAQPTEPDNSPPTYAPVKNAAGRKQPVTSRSAENLFWLGRYTERAENSLRLAQLTLQCLGGEDQSSQTLLRWLTEMAVNNALVLDTVPPATHARRVFERSLIAGLANTEQTASVGYNLRAVKSAASSVRERLSQEQWQIIVRAEADFFSRCEAFKNAAPQGPQAPEYSSLEALRALESASGFLAAVTGAQTDRMMRDDGWRLLSIGRHIERLSMLSAALASGFETGAVFDSGGFSAMVALFDSTITFHAQYQQRRDIPALLDLLVLDRDNPRSLGWVLQTVRARLAKLAGNSQEAGPLADDLAAALPDPAAWVLATLHDNPSSLQHGQSDYEELIKQFEDCQAAAFALSDQISRRYFSHATTSNYSVVA